MNAERLPFGSEFSPQQVALPAVLELLAQASGDCGRIEEGFYRMYFSIGRDTTEENKRKLAMNARLALQSYGLLDAEGSLTEIARTLHELRHDEVRLYEVFARHILTTLNGLVVVQCVQDMCAAGTEPTLNELRRWLGERGIRVPSGSRDMSTLKLWLEKAGIFSGKYRVDETALERVLGLPQDKVDVLGELTSEQRAYVMTICNLGAEGSYSSSRVRELAQATYGRLFDEKNLPKQVLYPLRDAGLITLERTTAGRGAKPFTITPTAELRAKVVVPILQQIESRMGTRLRGLLRKPLADVVRDLDGTNIHTKGLALEAFAFKLMRLIDLDYVATRRRGDETGGAEVDLVFEATRLHYSRWQVQCKNVRTALSIDDVAREVGLVQMLKSNVIVIVSRGSVSGPARRFAQIVMKDTNLCIALLDQRDVEHIVSDPTEIAEILNREARAAMKVKELKLD